MPAITPAAGAPGQSSQAPFGASPVTGPTPNKGFEAAAMQRLGLVIKQLEELISMSGATSEVGQAALKMLNIGVKLVPAGAVTPAAQKNSLDQMQMKNQQQNQQMQALKAQSQQGQQPAQQMPQAA